MRVCVGAVVFILVMRARLAVLAPHITHTHTLRFLSSALPKRLTTARACLRASRARIQLVSTPRFAGGTTLAEVHARLRTPALRLQHGCCDTFHRGYPMAFPQIYSAFSHVLVAFMPCCSRTLCERWKASQPIHVRNAFFLAF
jgi:hypothetical protein